MGFRQGKLLFRYLRFSYDWSNSKGVLTAASKEFSVGSNLGLIPPTENFYLKKLYLINRHLTELNIEAMK